MCLQYAGLPTPELRGQAKLKLVPWAVAVTFDQVLFCRFQATISIPRAHAGNQFSELVRRVDAMPGRSGG